MHTPNKTPRFGGRWSKTASFAVVFASLMGATYLTAPWNNISQPAQAQQATTTQAIAPTGFADLVEKVKPSVVSIQVQRRNNGDQIARGPSGVPNLDELPEGHPLRRFFDRFRSEPNGPDQRRRFANSLGSGFIVSEDGYVVTNDHVVDRGEAIKVVTWDGTEYDAELVGTDSRSDVGVLKIKSDKTFTPVKFAKKEARVGDWVVAVGSPFGLGGSVTTGIISARGREIGTGPYDDYLQIDAAINRGSSGGPAFNLDGEVIGVNTAIFSPSGGNVGIGFAIPASLAEPVVSDLIDDGNVTRGWLGVQIQNIDDDIAKGLGLENAEGALIADIVPDSPAASAGLKAGDAILEVNGEAVENLRDLARKVAEIEPGTVARFTLMRNHQRQTQTVEIGVLEDERQLASRGGQNSEPADSDSRRLGLQLRPAQDDNGRDAVAIAAVDPDGPAAEKGLQSGDLILEVNGKRVSNPKEVANAVKQAGKSDRSTVLMLVRSGDRNRFVAVPVSRG